MIIPGPQLLHQLNASTNSENDNDFVSQVALETIEDQPDEPSSSSLLVNSVIDDGQVRQSATPVDTPITQQGMQLRISSLYKIYYAATLIIDLGLLGLILYKFQTNRCILAGTTGNCLSDSQWASSSSVAIIASFILLVLIGVSLFLCHNPYIYASENLLDQEKSVVSKPNCDTVSNFRRVILSALGSIHAPFPSILYNHESCGYGDSNAAIHFTDTTGKNTLSNEFNYSEMESCRRLVQAIVRLIVHIDSTIQALQMATGLQFGIGITSLAIYRVEQSFRNRLASTNSQPSARRDSVGVERLKRNLFRIMVDAINHLENINITLLEHNVVQKINIDTETSEQSSTIKNLNELNRVVDTRECTSLSLSLLKSCRWQVASSLSRFTTTYLLSRGFETYPSSVSVKIQKLIHLATDGTEYLYQALFPYASPPASQRQSDITKQESGKRNANENSETFRILINLDAARILLWCIQENRSMKTLDTTINEEDKDSSLFPEFTHPDIERLLQSQKLMAEALSLTKCLLERNGKGNSMSKQQCKEAIDYSTTNSPLKNTEGEQFGRQMQVFEAGCVSKETDRIITDTTTNSQGTTRIYSGQGERYLHSQLATSVREPSRTTRPSSSVDNQIKAIGIMAPEDAANAFIGELQTRLLELGLPEERKETNANKDDKVSYTSSSVSAGSISPLLPLTAKSNLFFELKELHKLMHDKGDLIPQEPSKD